MSKIAGFAIALGTGMVMTTLTLLLIRHIAPLQKLAGLSPADRQFLRPAA